MKLEIDDMVSFGDSEKYGVLKITHINDYINSTGSVLITLLDEFNNTLMVPKSEIKIVFDKETYPEYYI